MDNNRHSIKIENRKGKKVKNALFDYKDLCERAKL